MNSKRRTGYGVYDLSRQVARRLQREWDSVECPPRPTHWSAPVIALPLPPRHPARIQHQPLAA